MPLKSVLVLNAEARDADMEAVSCCRAVHNKAMRSAVLAMARIERYRRFPDGVARGPRAAGEYAVPCAFFGAAPRMADDNSARHCRPWIRNPSW